MDLYFLRNFPFYSKTPKYNFFGNFPISTKIQQIVQLNAYKSVWHINTYADLSVNLSLN